MESSRERLQGRAEDVLLRGVGIMRVAFEDVILERATRPKFLDAERVVLRVLDDRIAAIEANTKPGSTQTQKVAELLRVHRDMKADIQAALDERWRNRDIG